MIGPRKQLAEPASDYNVPARRANRFAATVRSTCPRSIARRSNAAAIASGHAIVLVGIADVLVLVNVVVVEGALGELGRGLIAFVIGRQHILLGMLGRL